MGLAWLMPQHFGSFSVFCVAKDISRNDAVLQKLCFHVLDTWSEESRIQQPTLQLADDHVCLLKVLSFVAADLKQNSKRNISEVL